MSENKKHTPLPWATELFGELIVGPNERVVARCAFLVDGVGGPDEIIANAEFIVRACNSHYQLVEALESVWADWCNSENAIDPDAEGYETLQEVKAALLAAGVKL